MITARDTLDLPDAVLVGDSIVGRDPSDRNRRVGVAVADARVITIRRFNRTDTMFLMLGLAPIVIPALVVLLLYPDT